MKRLITLVVFLGVIMTGMAQDMTAGVIVSRVMSPDGTVAVFKLVLPMLAERYDGDLPGTLVLHDLTAGTASVISGQAENFVCDETMGCRNSVTQGIPAFSPDGAQIAWAERVEPDGVMRLAVHSIATGTTNRFDNAIALGFQDAGLSMPRPSWGEGGIIHLFPSYLADNNPHSLLQIVDPASGESVVLDLHTFGIDEAGRQPHLAVWAEAADRPVIGVVDDAGRWRVIDLDAGTDTPTSETPYAYLYRAGSHEPYIALQPVYDADDFAYRLSLDPNADEQQDRMDVAFILNDEQRFMALEAAERLLAPHLPQLTVGAEGETIAESGLSYDYEAGPADTPQVRWRFNADPDEGPMPLIYVSDQL